MDNQQAAAPAANDAAPTINLAYGTDKVCIKRSTGEVSHEIADLSETQVAGVMALVQYWGALCYQAGQVDAKPAEPSRIILPGSTLVN